MTLTDPHELQRFVQAQQPLYVRVQAELRSGRKSSHWMWFVFPQWSGLGHSPMAERYAIASLDEAHAYMAHPLLGQRLQECTRLAIDSDAASARMLFGHPDDMKFQSCMTLFSQAAPESRVFAVALDRFFGGARDRQTLALITTATLVQQRHAGGNLPSRGALPT